jgi:SAM-dependent methyltransferase
MVEAASQKSLPGVELEVKVGDAEHIDLADNSVDHLFSYALMKHLTPNLRLKVLKEFARVSRNRIAVSFGIANRISFWLWKLRGSSGPGTMWWTDLETIASEVPLSIGAVYRSGLPWIGMETIVVFEKIPS